MKTGDRMETGDDVKTGDRMKTVVPARAAWSSVIRAA